MRWVLKPCCKNSSSRTRSNYQVKTRQLVITERLTSKTTARMETFPSLSLTSSSFSSLRYGKLSYRSSLLSQLRRGENSQILMLVSFTIGDQNFPLTNSPLDSTLKAQIMLFRQFFIVTNDILAWANMKMKKMSEQQVKWAKYDDEEKKLIICMCWEWCSSDDWWIIIYHVAISLEHTTGRKVD